MVGVSYGDAPRTPTVMTVHNLAFQGAFPANLLGVLGLPEESFTVDGVEYHGQIGFLKAGLRLADRITTVSPTYASEICSAEFGMGLEGLLRGRADVLSGILNGIDTEVWNPAADPFIPAVYTAGDLAARAADKAALQARLGLDTAPRAAVRGDLAARLAERAGPAPRRPTGPAQGGRPARPAGRRRCGIGGCLRRRRRGACRERRLRQRL
jgi:starch synthase